MYSAGQVAFFFLDFSPSSAASYSIHNDKRTFIPLPEKSATLRGSSASSTFVFLSAADVTPFSESWKLLIPRAAYFYLVTFSNFGLVASAWLPNVEI